MRKGVNDSEKGHNAGNIYEAVPRSQECCRQVEAEVVRNSRNKIHQTWEQPFRGSQYSDKEMVYHERQAEKCTGPANKVCKT